MNIAQIEENVQNLLKNYSEDTFIFNLLEVYGKPKSSIARLQNGNYNLLNKQDEILWKKVVYFTSTKSENLHSQIDEARKNKAIISHQPRFLIITDYKTFLAVDTKTDDTLDIAFSELGKNFDFFLPWAGMEKAQHKNENPADVKAAEKMAKLYDEILKDNPVKTTEELHQLNVFLSRLLFCFFAEDTEIFPKASFTHSISSHTQRDGSDLNTYLHKLFEVLNTPNRSKYPEFLKVFPYVNGGLFTEAIYVPEFSHRSRAMIIEAGELDWSGINPDIFGSMFQAVVHVDQRAEMGMHYTSVPNIMKVIEPLFLNELYEEFDKASESESKLEALLLRIEKIRIFDPACGSGNFLIIAYKEIRNLEMLILQRINQISKNKTLRFSNISLSNFYGIELDDFAHEVAILSLWLAEHQMNVKFKSVFGNSNPSLPLKKGGNIFCGNSINLDWTLICPQEINDETVILGNPPYIGARNQSSEQKLDLATVFNGHEDYKNSDYVCCWFLKAATYIANKNSKFAFVSTNSICQGEQVAYLWSRIFALDLEIDFAHTSFKWTNHAKNNAGVTCVIVGIRNHSTNPKILFRENTYKVVRNINPYLIEGENIYVKRTSSIVSDFPGMVIGCMARDGGNLILSPEEMDDLLKAWPESKNLFKTLYGTQEFISGVPRKCLWIEDSDISLANSIPPIKARIENCYKFRMASKAKTTRVYAKIPHKFAQRVQKNVGAIIVPATSSERREYIPIGYLGNDVVITNSANVIYEQNPVIFGIVSSKLHILWVKSVGGQLETRIRYSAEICYNTFPFPEVDAKNKSEVASRSMNVIQIREKFPEMSIEHLYDPDNMPEELFKAHQQLDIAVEQCYRSKPFTSDEERLEYLFKLYEEMTNKEKSKANA
ncbi:DNA methyltransferase [Methylotenera sp.]|uniref:class I SAM-dependent DNA methyltransferase n=1 Tax=Methylotenera sp. TaxID=2051956 RepID=UPI0027340D6D|nr:DNA methyltransferase [Methylotenera sp.]MDP3211904.1 N-6 DNA methylase [Methylotenera sp.]